jgi:hypothetical protein
LPDSSGHNIPKYTKWPQNKPIGNNKYQMAVIC